MAKITKKQQFSNEEVVTYIAALSSELSIMATGAEKPMLAYFLKMVEAEAHETLTTRT